MKILKTILHVLKIMIFGLLSIFAVWILMEGSYEYGKYLINSRHILAAYTQCESFYINIGFIFLAVGSFIGVFAGLFPPKRAFFAFLVFFWLLMLLAASREVWDYAIYPFNYVYPDENIIYANKIKGDCFAFAWSALGVLQVYLKPPLRKYVISVHLAATLLNAFVNGTFFN